jgi:hypothetical protein
MRRLSSHSVVRLLSVQLRTDRDVGRSLSLLECHVSYRDKMYMCRDKTDASSLLRDPSRIKIHKK